MRNNWPQINHVIAVGCESFSTQTCSTWLRPGNLPMNPTEYIEYIIRSRRSKSNPDSRSGWPLWWPCVQQWLAPRKFTMPQLLGYVRAGPCSTNPFLTCQPIVPQGQAGLFNCQTSTYQFLVLFSLPRRVS